MATASFERVRKAFPNAHITAGMRPYLRLMAHGSDYFDDIVETPQGGGLKALRRQVRDPGEGRGQRQRVTGNLGAEPVGAVFSRPADRHLHQPCSKGRQNDHQYRAD